MSVMIECTSAVARATEPRIRIVIAEDHAILREGLKALIEFEPDFEIAGDFDFRGVAEGLASIRRLQPDLVLTDLPLPGRSGFELLAGIKNVAPRARKLVLTAHNSEESIRAALNAGADGYVLKEANRAELMLAIRTVSAGRQFLCRSPHAHSITGREREVLTRIALGESNKVIARALVLSVKTIEKHRSNLMRKLHLHNAAAITLFAVRNGFTGDPRFAVQFGTGLQRNISIG
jgi:DNA-binding NarL/FixJ family response regulator